MFDPIFFLKCAYFFNILLLIPVVGSLLFGKNYEGLAAFNHKIKDERGLSLLVASFWLAILICSICGLFFPLQFWSILLLQIVYKAIYLMVYIFPFAIQKRFNEIPQGVAISFIIIVITYPIILMRLW